VKTDYEQLLIRDPESFGLAFWTTTLDQGVNPSQVLIGFVSTSEYFAQPAARWVIAILWLRSPQ
jgi:hypothetical protein